MSRTYVVAIRSLETPDDLDRLCFGCFAEHEYDFLRIKCEQNGHPVPPVTAAAGLVQRSAHIFNPGSPA